PTVGTGAWSVVSGPFDTFSDNTYVLMLLSPLMLMEHMYCNGQFLTVHCTASAADVTVNHYQGSYTLLCR
ncbi:MAG: hypothetical protein IPH84_18290, partial [Bacteroidales bacterium]|nr:hypothetical protein [Bacteroidales bacterium]